MTPDGPRLATLALAASVGAVAGSFAATAALRSVRSEGALRGRSHCDACRVPLGFAQTAPILSYLLLGGVSACCRRRIDPVHLIGEAAGALAFLAAFALFPPAPACIAGALALVLVAASVIDLKTWRLPDRLNAAAAVLAGALAVQLQGWAGLLLGLACAAAAYLVLQLVRAIFFTARRRHGLGGGDVKLLAAMALCVGPGIAPSLAAAAMLGLAAFLIVRPADGRIAFGPALAASSFAVLLGQGGRLWT